MFQGETQITIDDKGRMAIPTAYRDVVARESGNRLVVTYNPWESGCLWIWPFPAWEKVRDEVAALSSVKAAHRQLQLKLIGAATVLEPDANGRVLLPASQRNAVGLDKKAVLLGMGNKFELWSEAAHMEQVRKTLAETDVSEAMLELSL
jgi:MraZ protein